MQTSYKLIDVRTPEEFLTGHIDGALNIEYQTIDQTLASLSFITYEDEILLYCRSGRRSGIAEQVLKRRGYHRAQNIGTLEEARMLLAKRNLPEAKQKVVEDGKGVEKEVDEKRPEKLKSSLKALMEGLQDEDGET